MKVHDYLERLKSLAPRPSVYAVAQLLEVHEEQVRHWAKGRSRPDNLACVRIAEILDIDPMKVIADVEAEREKDEGKKARWRALARKLSGWALIAICTAIGNTPDSAQASRMTPSSLRVDSAAICIMSSRLRRFLQRLCPHGFGRFPAFGS